MDNHALISYLYQNSFFNKLYFRDILDYQNQNKLTLLYEIKTPQYLLIQCRPKNYSYIQ